MRRRRVVRAEPMTCRICLDPVLTPSRFAHCNCKGSLSVHTHCLERWIDASKQTRCEICGQKYLHVRNRALWDEENDDEDVPNVVHTCMVLTRQLVGVFLTLCVVVALG